jgi:hypothetical protein
MTARTPLKLNGSNIQEMTSAEINLLRKEARRLYGNSPSVTLSVVSSGGNLGTINDTRLQAGAGATRADRFATTSELGDVSAVTVGYSRISQTYNTSESNWSNSTYSYPLYFDNGHLKEMSAQDFADTFIYPAIDTLTTGAGSTDQAGTYHISTSQSVSGSTLISSTPVFQDTRANADAYTAAGLIETRDQPETIQNYYLHRINAAGADSFPQYLSYTKSGTNVKATPDATIRDALETMVRYYAAEISGTKISYNFNGSGQNCGTGMTDTRVSGGQYLTYQVNLDDYRAQETPDYNAGSTVITTHRLRITQV